MSNLLLIYDPYSETKKVTRKSTACNSFSICEEVTELSAPHKCEAGEKMLVFFKDPSVLVPSANGVLVADIVYRRFISDQYHYYVTFADSLLGEGISPNNLNQCDVLKACCYDCSAEYADIIVAAQHNE